MIRSYRTEGIIIKRKNFGEADRILTIFSKNHGKIQAKAPGVRKITSRRSPHIELLNFTSISLYKSSRSLLPILTEAHTIEDFAPIKNTLERVGFAYYICELIDGLCPENQENEHIFKLLKETLFELSEGRGIKNLLFFFEKKLLEGLGFWSEAKLLDRGFSERIIENILERKLKTRRTLHLFQNEIAF